MTSDRRTDLLFYALGIVMCAASYMALNQNIELSLFPHKAVIGVLFRFEFVFVEDIGYEQTNGLFIIAKNCLGAKLFMSLFLMMTFGFLQHYKGVKNKAAAVVKFYFSSLVLAFMVTVARISLSVPLCTWDRFRLAHNMISLVMYFSAGLIVYFVMEKKVRIT